MREGFDSSFPTRCKLVRGAVRCHLGDVLVGRVPAGERWQQWVLPTALSQYHDFKPASIVINQVVGRPGRRIAHVISLNESRFNTSLRELARAGFDSVAHVRPVSISDRRVLEVEHRHRRDGDDLAGSPRRIIANLITLVDLWHSHAVTQDNAEWIYVFEDDALLLPHMSGAAAIQCLLSEVRTTIAACALVSELKAGSGSNRLFDASQHRASLCESLLLHRSCCIALALAASLLLHRSCCIASQAERRASAANHTLLFLGSTAEHLEEPMTPLRCQPGTKGSSRAAAGAHTIRPCAPLSAHAYAFRRGHASTLWELVRYFLHQWSAGRGQLLYRYDVDIAVRAFYWRARAHGLVMPALEWPLCIDAGSQAGHHGRHGYNGFFGQATFQGNADALPHNWTLMRWRR